MKKTVLIMMLIINVFFIVSFFSGLGFWLNNFWTLFFGLFFIISILFSSVFFFRSRKKSGYHPYLSITVLAMSVGSFGWFVFLNYLTLIIG